MAQPPTDVQARVASETAQSFVDHYYEALSRRYGLGQYYASASPLLTAASVKPDISINGHVCETVADFEALLNKQGGPVTYDIRSFDAQPVNPSYAAGAPERNPTDARKGERLSVAVQVSGAVHYGRGHGDATTTTATDPDINTTRPFNEAFLLVPHWEAWARNAPRGLRRWVIVSQNFRAL
ncbi:hypothetical protein F4779DRAFT_253999 [Xylariaceae sp. FL0662B]|nr:hypothetical protein F4779DRAFT_253999 [Xylariaceae sp. FL0662B]